MSVSTQPDFGTNFSGIFLVSYGLLYNWYAITDVKNIAATGWGVPTKANYDTLIAYLGGTSVAGTAMQSTSGFDLLLSGARTQAGAFVGLGLYIILGVSDNIFGLVTNGVLVSTSASTSGEQSFKAGLYHRLIKDTTTLTDGETGTYTGNDGRVYRTICIGTQEWLAENLAETKYRNGDTIPEVTNNSTWAALSTGALCVFNNDWSYI